MAKNTTESKEKPEETVKMKRYEPIVPGGPTEADVHPEEVESWKLHGWFVAEPPKEEKSK